MTLLPLAWLWFRLINHLRLEWSVNPQYAYGWAVPFLCVYLLWRRVAQASPPAAQGSGFTVHDSESKVQGSGFGARSAQPCSIFYLLWQSAKRGAQSAFPLRLARGEGQGLSRQSVLATADEVSLLPSVLRPPFSAFSFSAFQLFSFSLLSFLYLPTRLIQEANPEWRLVSWALALEVIGITLLVLPFVLDAYHASRITHPASGISAFCFSDFQFPIVFFLVSVPWPTFIEAPLIQGLMRANIGVTIELLGVIGVPAIQHGNVIEIATGSVGIDEACSGIRSFQAALMLSLFFGEVCRLTVRRRLGLVGLGFVLAFAFNVGRTLLLTQVASARGIGAVATWHDPAGVTILVACFLSLWLIARALRKAESRKQKAEIGGQSAEGRGQHVAQASSPASSASIPAGKFPDGPTQSSKLDVRGSRFDVRPAPPTPPSSPPSVRFLLSAFPISAFQCVSICLIAWLLLVETGTELWYRSHEWRVPESTLWHVELPRDNPTFRDLPFSDNTRQLLRYDEGYNGTWQESADQRWQAIFLRWNPGRIAVHLAKSHTPEVCLTAAGRELVSQSGLRAVPVRGLQLPFRSYVVKDETGPLHVFYCLWEDRASAQSFRSARMTYANRLAPVLAGRRNSGERSLEIAIWGIADQNEADAALARELEKLIKIEQ